MLEELLRTLNNWFEHRVYRDTYTIEGGQLLDFPPCAVGQYFRIAGSALNDGLHMHPALDLNDEEFEGTVATLHIPAEVVRLAEDIEAWKEQNPKTAFVSESFGGYSYSKAADANGNPLGWKSVFADDLRRWRKL